jgi:hypothetical protein
MNKILLITATCLVICFFSSCSGEKKESGEEQISAESPFRESSDTRETPDSTINSIEGNVSLSQIGAIPHHVILTGLQEHRLVSVYKSKKDIPADNSYRKDIYDENDGADEDRITHFMPGIDILYGFNLLNVAHYGFQTEKLNYLFPHPVLVKSLYYPSYEQDSLNGRPVNRNYYLVSVYDGDSNKDTLINKKDLRRLYHFNTDCSVRTLLVPADHSVIRSEYDPGNDVMYIYAVQDTNKNGSADKKEPMHIFWISLKEPVKAKRLY